MLELIPDEEIHRKRGKHPKTDFSKVGFDWFMARATPEPNSGCWLWLGAVTLKGYGHLKIRPRDWAAHRLAFTVFVRSLNEGEFVLHKCDTPACVNPDHLFTGSQADNLADMGRKGRHWLQKTPWRSALYKHRVVRYGEKHGHATVSDKTIAAIRSRALEGVSTKRVAAEFGLSYGYVWRVLRGISRRVHDGHSSRGNS